MTEEAVAIARLEARMDYLLHDWENFKAVLLNHSGDVAQVRHLMEKHTDLVARVESCEARTAVAERRLATIENRRSREAGVIVGVFAALQVLWALGRELVPRLLGVQR